MEGETAAAQTLLERPYHALGAVDEGVDLTQFAAGQRMPAGGGHADVIEPPNGGVSLPN